LKCCLNYELDTYLDALKDFPDFDLKIRTEKGDALCQKQDIFKGLMWYAYTDNFANWHVLSIESVKEITAQNKQSIKVSSLEDYAVETIVEPEKDFNNAMGQESLTRFDQPKRSKNKNKNKAKSKAPGSGPNQNQGQGQVQNQSQAQNPNPEKKRPIIIKKNENKE
jgi:hypothetical protein